MSGSSELQWVAECNSDPEKLKRLKSMVCNSAELQLSCAELRLSCGSILGAFWTDLKEDAAAEAGSSSRQQQILGQTHCAAGNIRQQQQQCSRKLSSN